MRRSIRLARGVRLNLGKRSSSITFGRGPFHVNLGKRGLRSTFSLPGTGLSYTTPASGAEDAPRYEPAGATVQDTGTPDDETRIDSAAFAGVIFFIVAVVGIWLASIS